MTGYLYSIGDFSRMTRLTVKALRLYDEQGIFRPGYTDPRSGYRYYSSAQLPEARMVRMLRSMEMPLEDIRAFLRAGDGAGRRSVLEGHRARILRQAEEYRAIIESLERMVNGEEETMERTIEVKELADQPILSVRFRTSLAAIGDDLGKAYGAIFGYIGRAGAVPVGPPGTLYYGEEFSEDDVDAEAYAPVAEVMPGEGEVVGRLLPGGKVASTMHAGSYQSIGDAYEAVMTWMSENGYKPSGPAREVYLTDPNAVKDPAGNRTEVVFPIEPV